MCSYWLLRRSQGRFVESLPGELVIALAEHNGTHCEQEQIRLRMALHAGEVYDDQHGVTAASVNLTFRLLEAPQLKAALAESSGTLGLIASGWFFDEVIRHAPAGSPAADRPFSVTVKETATVGWIARPDDPYPPAQQALDTPPALPAPLCCTSCLLAPQPSWAGQRSWERLIEHPGQGNGRSRDRRRCDHLGDQRHGRYREDCPGAALGA